MIFPCSLIPSLTHGGHQQLALAYRTATKKMTKNQINNVQNKPMSHHGLSAHAKTLENNNNNNNNDVTYSNNSSSSTSNKLVILDFYDNDIGQFTYAKSILDKYGFKGTFFIVCNWASSHNPERMTWQEINQLYREGHDIESHTMTHKPLDGLSATALDYQVGQSKQCLYDHLGIYPTVFSPPHGKGWNNATVIDTIAEYYDFSIGGFVSSPMFLDCYG
jgi:peptidoglycan/xylan/chitin deacetylase (PgdA/CDA1 family)